MREKPSKKPGAKEMFDYLTGEATSLLIRQGESQAESLKQATAFTMRVLEKIGGGQLFIPKKTYQNADDNRSELRTKFNLSRESVAEFARNNSISNVWAYHILKPAEHDSDTKKNRLQFLPEITVEAARMLVITGVSIHDAVPMAMDFVSVMFGKYRGQQLYFPSVKLFLAKQRADDIWKKYQAGHKVDEIAIRYGLSLQAAYLIIRERCQETGNAPPGRIRKKHPLILLQRKILQIAEDYRTGNQQAFDTLQNIAGQIDSVRQSLQQKEGSSN